MNTSRRKFLGTAALAALAASFTPAQAALIKSGARFPDLTKAGLEGTLPEVAGKIVVIDFWASWCGPCKKALPTFIQLHQTYSPKGVVFLAISLDENKADMDGYLKKHPLPFASLRDTKGKFAESLGIEGIPTSMLLKADGTIHAVHEGFEGEKSRKKYVAELDELLQAK
jgi:cytochrome c biogenesis protein CcmG/thiol:disulfide interchange protein DsbE